MKLQDCVGRITRQFEREELFYGHGTDNPADEAFYLVFAALGLDFGDAERLMAARELDREELQKVHELARRRVQERVPVAYLVGEAWFAGLAFHVNPHVLIPRSPIAELIANGFAPLLETEPRQILDLCTGSGCIGIACAQHWPSARVVLSDVSGEALAVANENVRRHGLEDRVHVLESDLFASLDDGFDLIVSNPPYVADEEMRDLPPEYRHEPALGLRSADEGLDIPLRILREAAAHLTDTGVLVLELGHSWQALARRLPRMPFVWLEFEHGGEGVLALDRASLLSGLAEQSSISE